jgi:hypothetical protein
MTILTIVQCGGQKVWKTNPQLGPVAAKDAYTSSYFKKNVAYAKKFGNRWIILSAKYGFLDPEELIEDYNVTFKVKKSGPISTDKLKEQIKSKELDSYDKIVVLGGKEYLEPVRRAFEGTGCVVVSPFEGMRIGERMRALNVLIKD